MMEQGFLFEKTEYDILRRKSSFEDVDDEKNADYSTLIGSHDTEPHPLTNSVPSLIKILLVFPKDDQQMDILATTSRRLGWSVSVAKDAEKALEFFQARGHELVIIDHRGQRAAEADIICRAIRASPFYYNSIIIALVKKSYLMHSESEKIVTLDLLEIGYTKTLMECAHERILINELVGIYTSGILPRTQLVAANMLYMALDRCRDMIHVTDDKYIIQFANKISEKILGYRVIELWGKNITDLILYDNFIQMEQHIIKGREYDGNLNCIRRNNQMVTVNCRVIPFAYFKKPTHYIFIYDTTYLSENIQPLLQPTTHPKTVVISQKRISEVNFKGIQDVRRRLSKRDLQTLQLEAPITKVIGLLTASIKEDTASETKLQIEKAIDILKTTELYSPVFKEQGDPAADFIEALITPKKSWDVKKPSVESIRDTPSKTLAASTRMQIKGYRGPQEIAEILEKSLEWDFDIFKLEVLTEKRALLFLGMTIMNLFRVPARLGCEEKIVQNWLIVIEANYDSMNRYHNSTHAADVLQATAMFMQTERLKQVLEPLDEVAALIAAAAHDIDHPGRSSQFLCNSDNKLAILYNDLTVLESHHAALTFKLTLSDDNVNIFKNLERDTYKQVRAKDIGAPPALLARNVLEKHCGKDEFNVSRNEVSKLFKDTTLIQDKDLAYEVYLLNNVLQCILYDNLYGPISDAVGTSVGQEYELKLQNYLTERNLAFRNEEHLRSRGYDKTPDFKLEVPIAINGFVINWIESKARFGNTEIHQKYIKEQFLSYWNRFGPGLVIYWFGFLDNLSEPNEKRFIIMDHFPEEITYMDPTCIKPTTL